MPQQYLLNTKTGALRIRTDVLAKKPHLIPCDAAGRPLREGDLAMLPDHMLAAAAGRLPAPPAGPIAPYDRDDAPADDANPEPPSDDAAIVEATLLGDPDRLLDLNRRDLEQLCEERGVRHSARDNKSALVEKLAGTQA
ncbi:MAG: hypothetical protein PWQ57_3315 [Desulfovibrionales bacterium]|nr:hypothetical protein [Desulfovibrionales bacterium]